jgi:hypothetical protein
MYVIKWTVWIVNNPKLGLMYNTRLSYGLDVSVIQQLWTKVWTTSHHQWINYTLQGIFDNHTGSLHGLVEWP